jgi:hypothetical protein
MLHRKLVCYVSPPHHIREPGQRSPPPVRAPQGTRWDQLPPTNQHRLLLLLGRLVERQLPQPAPLLLTSREEAEYDLPH